jgi:PhzF family phenazine biosynthesis protein
MWQSPLDVGPPVDRATKEQVLEALGLGESAVAKGLPLCTASAGHAKLLVPVEDPEALLNLRPDNVALRRLSARTGVNGYLAFARQARGSSRFMARMFGPAIGIAEDPFNGSGQGPLGAYLVAHGWLRPRGGRAAFSCRMGDAMARPGAARVDVEVSGGRAVRARVEGEVVVVFRTTLRI